MSPLLIFCLSPRPLVPLSPCLSSAARLEHFDVALHVMAPSTRLSVIAAEDYASVALFPIVATETAAAAGLSGGVVLFDYGRGWRILNIVPLDRMTFSAVHVFDVLDVRELGAVGAALQLGGEWFGPGPEPLCMADHAVIFDLSFFVKPARRVANVTFGVRADGYGQSFLSRFVAIGALHLFAVGQFVSDVKFMLLGVE